MRGLWKILDTDESIELIAQYSSCAPLRGTGNGSDRRSQLPNHYELALTPAHIATPSYSCHSVVMDPTKAISPPSKRHTAGQRAADKLFSKSPGWKERFRLQCLERINDLRYHAQLQHRMEHASREGTEMHPTNARLPLTSGDLHMSVEETETEWMQHLIEQELSVFEHINEDEEIEYQLTLEDQTLLSGHLSTAYHRDLDEDGS